MRKTVLFGPLVLSCGTFSITSVNITDYHLIVYRDDIRVANVYYHPTAHEYVLDTLEASLKRDTLMKIMTLMNLETFRYHRKRLQRQHKQRRKK